MADNSEDMKNESRLKSRQPYTFLPTVTQEERRKRSKMHNQSVFDIQIADKVLKQMETFAENITKSNISQWEKFTKSLIGGMMAEFIQIRRDEAMKTQPFALTPLREMMLRFLEDQEVFTKEQADNYRRNQKVIDDILEIVKDNEETRGQADYDTRNRIFELMDILLKSKTPDHKSLDELVNILEKFEPGLADQLNDFINSNDIKTKDEEESFEKLIELGEEQKSILAKIADYFRKSSAENQFIRENLLESMRQKGRGFASGLGSIKSGASGIRQEGSSFLDSGSSFLGRIGNMIMSPEFVLLSIFTGWGYKIKNAIFGVVEFALGSVISVLKAPFKWLRFGDSIKKVIGLAVKKPFFVAGLAGLVTSILQVVVDGFEGYMKGDDFNTSKISAALGSAIAGSSQDIWGKIGNASKWGFVGLNVGMVGGPPGMIAGAIIGASLGILTNIIGPERISQWVDDATYDMKRLIDRMFNTSFVLDPKFLDDKINETKVMFEDKKVELGNINQQIIDINKKILEAQGNDMLLEVLNEEKAELEKNRNIVLSTIDRYSKQLAKYTRDEEESHKTWTEKLRGLVAESLGVSDSYTAILTKMLLDPTGLFKYLGEKIGTKYDELNIAGMVDDVGNIISRVTDSVKNFFNSIISETKRFLKEYLHIDVDKDISLSSIETNPINQKTSKMVDLLDKKKAMDSAKENLTQELLKMQQITNQSIVNNNVSNKNTTIQGRMSPIDHDMIPLSGLSVP